MTAEPEPNGHAELAGLLTVAQVAALAQVSRATIYSLVASGELHPVKLGGVRKRRFTRQEVARFLGEEVSG